MNPVVEPPKNIYVGLFKLIKADSKDDQIINNKKNKPTFVRLSNKNRKNYSLRKFRRKITVFKIFWGKITVFENFKEKLQSSKSFEEK